MAYKRWYDADPKLSLVVRAMEFMNLNSQLRFAQKLLELSEHLLEQHGGNNYIECLEPEKKAALEKSKAKNRWYDQYETLHRAFNNLYALDNEERKEVAELLVTPIEIVEGYERYCQRENIIPDMLVVEEILRSSFAEGERRTRKLYAHYLRDIRSELEMLNRQTSQRLQDEERRRRGVWTSLLENIQYALSPA